MALAKANGWLSATNRTKRAGVGMSWDLGWWEYQYMGLSENVGYIPNEIAI